MKDLKMMDMIMRFFAVSSYVLQWYTEAGADKVLTKEELAQLGLGICDILQLKTDIDL